ncbi:GBS Bsp-like repeat-containing protein [Eubacteriaceae bacterium ES3]|nr:GBS Bsp-like repeat-containing protein [Eubacteriaceae bacterium ES3]
MNSATIKYIKKLAGLLLAFILIFLTFSIYYTPPVQAASKQTIIINPGHQSGSDTGAVNKTTGITEVELNNALAIKVVQNLRNAGYNAMLSHQVPGNPGLPTLLSTTVNTSTSVCNAANKLGADLLVSIHHNSGGTTSSGYEFYWSSYHPTLDNDGLYQKANAWSDGSSATLDSTPPAIALSSKELANLFNSNFKASLSYIPSRNRIVERDDSILKKTSMPSVLIEAGFVSNNAESLLLANDSNQQAMANQVLKSIDTFFGNDTPTITASSVKASTSGEKITVTASGITTTTNVKSLSFAVWSDKGGQDDLRWYTATKQSDGSYQATVDIKDHQKQDGSYQIHCYGTDTNGKQNFLGSTIASVAVDKMSSSGVISQLLTDSTFKVSVSDIYAPDGLTEVVFPVWSETDGQDDIKWVTASKQSDGSYQATIDIKDHRYDGGTYNIHCYGKDSYGKLNYLGSTSLSMTVSTMSVKKISATSSTSGQITITATSVSAPYGLKEIIFPVWSNTNGQDDIQWVTATRQSTGAYQASISVADHLYNTGSYSIHCYGRDSYDKLTFLGNTSVDVNLDPMSAEKVTASVSGREITATLTGIEAPGGIDSVYFPVWTSQNGQDDVEWVKATKKSNGTYTCTINTSNHNNESGQYNIHCYGMDLASKTYQYLGHTSVKVTYTPATAKSITATVTENIAILKIDGLTTPNGVSKILVPSWSEAGGQDDIKWYTATKQSDGSYQVIVDAKNHKGNSGTYDFHVYCYESDGTAVFLGASSASIRYVETPIMGSTTITSAQLVAYYKSTGKVYPQLYNDLGVNLETFCDLYVKEAKAEGVRAEVAFAQAMLETGHLQFGKDVSVGQFNFAGLGATGNGAPGFNFAEAYGNNATGIQMGIRAHIQHLKCYASSLSLNNTNVDPRWNDKLRTKALSVEELAGTWAADLTYAPKVKAIMNKF